jgi:hypothetical protein
MSKNIIVVFCSFNDKRVLQQRISEHQNWGKSIHQEYFKICQTVMSKSVPLLTPLKIT